jgi:hypothetical protein
MGGAGLPLRDGVTPVVHGVSLPGTLMTYSLNTLNASSSARSAPRTGAARFGHEIGLVVGMLALLFWLLALLSYSARDAAWSTSGAGGAVAANWGGRLGAWLADLSYFLLGFSVWWCFAWLGFTGSGLLGIVLVVLGAAWVLRFSWGPLAEGLGARIDALLQSRRARREVAIDLAEGRRAARAREAVVTGERTDIEAHHPVPVQIIEPVLVDVPQSTRVVKERQKPLFTDMPDSRCRRWTCWTLRSSSAKASRPKRWK